MKEFILRPWSMGDAADFYRHSNNETIHKNMRDSFPKTPVDCAAAVQSFLEGDPNTTLFRAVEIGGEAAGSIGAHIHDDDPSGAEISYWLGESHWRGGVMTRAVTAFIEEIYREYKEVDHIVAYPFSFNAASKRMLEKIGFRRERTIYKEDCDFPVRSDYEKYVLTKRREA